jgi:hypothetical protein
MGCLRVRELDDDEGRRLVRIVRRDSGSVVTWRREQMVLRSAQGDDGTWEETGNYRSHSLPFSSASLINGSVVICSCWSRSAVLS